MRMKKLLMRKLRMTICRWLLMKSLWTEMNLRCFRIVLLGNNLGHVTEFRPREVQHLFLFNHKNDQNIFTRAQLKKKKTKGLDRIMTDTTLLLSSDSVLLSLLHRRAVILSTSRKNSAADNRHWKIKCRYRWRPTNDPSWKVCKTDAADNGVYIATIPWTKLPVFARFQTHIERYRAFLQLLLFVFLWYRFHTIKGPFSQSECII